MTEAQSQDQCGKALNVNRYATLKTISQGMLDIALFTANASQLRSVLQTKGQHSFYTLMLVLLGLSITLQTTAGISILYSGTLDVNKNKHSRKATLFNNLIAVQIFIITVVNIIIAAFGVEPGTIIPKPVCE